MSKKFWLTSCIAVGVTILGVIIFFFKESAIGILSLLAFLIVWPALKASDGGKHLLFNILLIMGGWLGAILLFLLIAYGKWHASWILGSLVGVVLLIRSYLNWRREEKERLAEEERRKEEQRRAEERLAEERLTEEHRKEEQRLAEERRKEEQRLAEEHRKEEQRLAKERCKEDQRRKEVQRKAEECRKRVQRRIEEQRLAEEQRKETFAKALRDLDESQKLFNSKLSNIVLVDSNIWMNCEYDVLFTEMIDAVRAMNFKMMLLGVQLDEMENLKNSSPDNDTKRGARCAFRRIDSAQDSNVLVIKNVTLNATRNAYADPEFIKYLLGNTEQGCLNPGVVFITDDRPLKIRIKAIAKEHHGKDFPVESGQELSKIADILSKARSVVDENKKYIV